MTTWLCRHRFHAFGPWLSLSWCRVRFCRRPGCWAQEQRR